jgi:hypothetical protein
MSKRASGVEKVESGVTVCRCTFARWHCTQACAHLQMLALTLDQTYQAFRGPDAGVRKSMKGIEHKPPECARDEWSWCSSRVITDDGFG